ncbi:MAG: pyrroloquinoline quinone biosynthesis protein PqqE [Deltaproteobacteria bacterium]|nr:MAG: pyrroloquinoline quinone biosynthesis protein PqqE [Deltaproteobacteria bacterium]
MKAPRPYNLIAELTYRCPLRCVYCSNPLAYREVRDELDASDWLRVFRAAAELGALHVGLTGGEPTLRADLEEIVRGATRYDLYAHLVTAGTTLSAEGLEALRAAGLRSVQLSIQDSKPDASDRIAGSASFERKLAFARFVKAQALHLSLNVVLHRHNLERVGELIELARALDADRLELANAQYYGWAHVNRAGLLPTRAQVDDAASVVRAARERFARPEILFVLPDFHRARPKPCMGGWGRQNLLVRPDGVALPCHAAAEIPGLEFWSVADRSLRACWEDAPGMNAFRGEAWMREPCRSCADRARDFGGCRCQALLLAGDAAATDPACPLSPHHALVRDARAAAEDAAVTSPPPSGLAYRGDRIG